MRVLFVNHTAQVSGAELAMLELTDGLRGGVECALLCPPGRLSVLARERGLDVREGPAIEGSLKLHPIHTTAALGQMIRLGVAARRLARQVSADLVDAASIRAGLACALARRLGSPPIVVHVQDVLPPGGVSRATVSTLGRSSAALIASSRFTAAGVAPWPAHVIPLPIDLERFNRDAVDDDGIGRPEEISSAAVVLAVIGQITPWKAQDLAIRTLAELANRGVDAVLLIAGETVFTGPKTRFDNTAYERDLRDLARREGVADRVKFLGHRPDVDAVLAATDLLLMPSHGEPFGRVVVEAMAMGVPVVAVDEGGPSETLRHEREGLLLGTRDPRHWADAVERLAERPDLRAQMGETGALRARDYHYETYARRVRAVYEEVLESERSSAVRQAEAA